MFSAGLFSQEITLTVRNKPLNNVLGMLGMEISFDDAALSVYQVSVSKTFESAEEALHYLLHDKPFKIEKINNVYIIIPNPDIGFDTLSTSTTDRISDITDGEYYYTTSIPLDEVIITANHIYHGADRTSYYITPSMRQGVSDIGDLLDKIPEVYVDKSINLIKVDNSKEVLLLVDGLPQSADYIWKLPPERIQSVEIINEPSGRFLSGNYTAIINFILKKDYRGYDVLVSNLLGVNTSGSKVNNGLMLEQPAAGLAYTHDKINMYATYTFNHEKQPAPISKNLSYYGLEFNSMDNKDTPNNFYKRNSHTATGGINFQLTPTQIIGVQGDYTSGNTHTLKLTNMLRGEDYAIQNSTKNDLTDNIFTGTLFYKGQINDRLNLYGDFSYNHYYNDIENDYTDTNGLKTENIYNESKNQTLLNIEGKYRFSFRSSIQAGYSHSWRKYASEDNGGNGFLNYNEYRNRAFAYFSIHPSKSIQGKIGAAIEHIKTREMEVENSYVRFLPYVQANFNINEKVNLRAGYSTNQHYPLLYQLSPMTMVIDTFLIQKGNPSLRTPVRHQASIRLSLWNRLIINSAYQYTRDEISELYTENGINLYRTFKNTRIKEYNLNVIFDQAVGKHFRFKNSIMYYVGQSVDAENNKSQSGWLVNSELSYFHPERQFGFQLGYHRNMKKNIIIQGYQMFDKDNWVISANKALFNNRMFVTLSYIPPITWGIRDHQSRELEASFYKEKTNLYLKPYHNMLLLKVNLRLNRGNSKPVERRNPIKKNEREQQTIQTVRHYTNL